MQRRSFVAAITSAGLAALAGCLGGGSKQSLEVSDVEMVRDDAGSPTETVTLTGTVTNISSNPVSPTVTVTFLRKGQELNPVEVDLGEIQPDASKEFEAESFEMGRTARQINGYKLEATEDEYTYTTESTQTPE